MAVVKVAFNRKWASFVGLSTDTKPTTGVGLEAGSTFYETDTKDTYTWDGSVWSMASDARGISLGSVGGFPSGNFHITSPSTVQYSNAVITGHNSYLTNTQLWYLGSASSSNNNIGFINRQNADLFFSTNNVERMRVAAGGGVSIGTSGLATSAILELSSTTKAFLATRMTTAQRDALTAVNGMIIYNTTTATLQGYQNGAWANL